MCGRKLTLALFSVTSGLKRNNVKQMARSLVHYLGLIISPSSSLYQSNYNDSNCPHRLSRRSKARWHTPRAALFMKRELRDLKASILGARSSKFRLGYECMMFIVHCVLLSIRNIYRSKNCGFQNAKLPPVQDVNF